MDIATAKTRIESTLSKLQNAIGEPVFDEWAIAEKNALGWKVIEYGGNREAEFHAEFQTDIAALKGTLDPANTMVGDFAFSHEGHGTGFDAHICAGERLFVLFNNTAKNTSEITENPKWTSSQIYFSELLESFITDPLTQ
ncbi:MAG TPA: hypothetical protein VIR63_07405 [Pontiella sp.]